MTFSNEGKRRVAILGCGWLGQPLGKTLAAEGWKVNGSTTHTENFSSLTSDGIIPFFVKISDTAIESEKLDEFLDASILVVNFPPGRSDGVESFHPAQMEQLVRALQKSKIEKLLFVSSTSVYPDTNGEVTEQGQAAPSKPSGKALLAAECILMNQDNFRTTVLRMGGLIGGDRIPGKFLSGKKDLKNGNVPVNLIHRDDCIGIIREILLQDIWGETFNACAPKHPLRKEFYRHAARIAGLPLPTFEDEDPSELTYKLVSPEKLIRILGYQFKFSDPMDAANC